ncbi:MAG: FliM/FliN family flagellar motor C-terminal domain-containing protein [Phycisphaerales bacterium]
MKSDARSALSLQVPIIVRLGERIVTVDDVIAWRPGTIIEINRNSDDDIDLLVNNVPIAQGVAVKVGENFGLQVTSVGDLRHKIEAMGGDDIATPSDARPVGAAPATTTRPEPEDSDSFSAGDEASNEPDESELVANAADDSADDAPASSAA